MFIQQMRLYAADNEVVVVQESQDHSAKKKKMTSMTFSQTMNQNHRAMWKLKQMII